MAPEATLPSWKRVVEPVALRAGESMAGFMPAAGGLPEGVVTIDCDMLGVAQAPPMPGRQRAGIELGAGGNVLVEGESFTARSARLTWSEAKDLLGVEVHRLQDVDVFNDIDGLLSAIDLCDIVLTIDNVTAHLAELAADIPFIFFSTDLVFDGRIGNYDETGPVSPINI